VCAQAENDANAALDALTNPRQRGALQLALATQQVRNSLPLCALAVVHVGRSHTAWGLGCSTKVACMYSVCCHTASPW
jgi:hypothetical protein